MKIAVIGGGISGMCAAHQLADCHDVTLFEENDYIGGHTHTVAIRLEDRTWQIDTGFIVFNRRNYPNFDRLMTELNVASQPTTMSLSVRCDRTGLEYNGSSLNQLFAQRRNLVRPNFHKMIRDVRRFGQLAPQLEPNLPVHMTTAEFLHAHDFSDAFRDWYLIPISAAIWSSPPGEIMNAPARFLIRFLDNHGMLQVGNRPQWRVIRGGSATYIRPLLATLRRQVETGNGATRVRRCRGGVEILLKDGTIRRYDRVCIATHSDQALALLADSATAAERSVLGDIRYQANDVILHTDASLLPRRRAAWGSWNYHIPKSADSPVAVTYNMNMLQQLDAPATFCVSLNCEDRINPALILRRFNYSHPQFTPEAVAAQARHREINGAKRIYFCGAYWGWGFHEDGVRSALEAVSHFNADCAAACFEPAREEVALNV